MRCFMRKEDDPAGEKEYTEYHSVFPVWLEEQEDEEDNMIIKDVYNVGRELIEVTKRFYVEQNAINKEELEDK